MEIANVRKSSGGKKGSGASLERVASGSWGSENVFISSISLAATPGEKYMIRIRRSTTSNATPTFNSNTVDASQTVNLGNLGDGQSGYTHHCYIFVATAETVKISSSYTTAWVAYKFV